MARISKPRSQPSPIEAALAEAKEDVTAFYQGSSTLRTLRVLRPGSVDVRAVRERLRLSQVQFAARFGFNLRTLQDWEQGRVEPDAAIRAYLTVIDRKPRVVARALAEEPNPT